MSGFQTTPRIVISPAFIMALPARTDELIFLVKGSALVSTVTLNHLTGAAIAIHCHTSNPFTLMVLADTISPVINPSLARLTRIIEDNTTGGNY